MSDAGWEHALACFYESAELTHAFSELRADVRNLHGDARVGGAILLEKMLGEGDVISDLPDLEQLESELIMFCSEIHAGSGDADTRQARCGATVAGAVAFIRWWANTLLGLHPDAIPRKTLPNAVDIIRRSNVIADHQDAITRRCAAATEGAVRAITLGQQRAAMGSPRARSVACDGFTKKG